MTTQSPTSPGDVELLVSTEYIDRLNPDNSANHMDKISLRISYYISRYIEFWHLEQSQT